MDLFFLTDKLINALKNLDEKLLYEIRLRINFPIKVNFNGTFYYLSENGITLLKTNSIICCEEDVKEIMNNLTENSLYAFNEYIRQGFITSKSGIRVGIAGECVCVDKSVSTIKNITSLVIRIPHEIYGSSNLIFDKVYKNGVINNSLLISPPFCGKTTILKDLAKKINDLTNKNILIIDERGEFSKTTGENIDSIKYGNKFFAFNYSIRSLSPEIVITDELSTEEDWCFAKKAVNSGIKIIASAHSNSIDNLRRIKGFENGVFDRYFVFDKQNGFGNLSKLYDFNFNLI